jgi:hypothetical protein
MKRLLTLSLIALLGIALNAQDFNLGNKTSYIYTGNSTISGTTENTKTLAVNKEYMYRYYIQANIDSGGDGTNTAVVLQGSNDGTNFTAITTVSYGATQSDTTIIFSNLAETNTISSSVAAHDLIARGTVTNASHNIIAADGDSTIFTTDSLVVDAQVYTRTDTINVPVHVTTTTETITTGKVLWRYLRLSCTGAGSGVSETIDWITWAIVKED